MGASNSSSSSGSSSVDMNPQKYGEWADLGVRCEEGCAVTIRHIEVPMTTTGTVVGLNILRVLSLGFSEIKYGAHSIAHEAIELEIYNPRGLDAKYTVELYNDKGVTEGWGSYANIYRVINSKSINVPMVDLKNSAKFKATQSYSERYYNCKHYAAEVYNRF